MRFLVRFMLLDAPDYCYEDAVQIHPDIPHDKPTHFGYGEVIAVGDDDVPSVLWPLYGVTEIPFMSLKPIDDPGRPGHKAYVEQIYLVREPNEKITRCRSIFGKSLSAGGRSRRTG